MGDALLALQLLPFRVLNYASQTMLQNI